MRLGEREVLIGACGLDQTVPGTAVARQSAIARTKRSSAGRSVVTNGSVER
jgi:hypothetical protein